MSSFLLSLLSFPTDFFQAVATFLPPHSFLPRGFAFLSTSTDSDLPDPISCPTPGHLEVRRTSFCRLSSHSLPQASCLTDSPVPTSFLDFFWPPLKVSPFLRRNEPQLWSVILPQLSHTITDLFDGSHPLCSSCPYSLTNSTTPATLLSYAVIGHRSTYFLTDHSLYFHEHPSRRRSPSGPLRG